MANPFGTTAAKAIRTAAGKADSRHKLMNAARAACHRQAICDEDRHALQLRVTGVASMADMTLGDLGKLLDHLNTDWKGPMGHRAYVGKIRALWWTIYWLGGIEDPKDEPLSAFVKRQTGKSKIQFLGHREAFKVIEALKAWAHRLGVSWPTDAQLLERRKTEPDLEMSQLERHAVLDTLSTELRAIGAIGFGYVAYCEKALSLGCNHFTWSPRELDAAIRLLGKMLRRQLGKAEAE